LNLGINLDEKLKTKKGKKTGQSDKEKNGSSVFFFFYWEEEEREKRKGGGSRTLHIIILSEWRKKDSA